MLTHANLAFVTASWLADLTPMDEADVTLHAAPLTHGAGFHALAHGTRRAPGDPGACELRSRGDPRAPPRARVTNTWMVPTQIVMLIDAPGDGRARDLPDLRHVVYGGAPFAAGRAPPRTRPLRPGVRAALRSGRDADDGDGAPRSRPRGRTAGDRPEPLASAGIEARDGRRVLDDADAELPAGDVGRSACAARR